MPHHDQLVGLPDRTQPGLKVLFITGCADSAASAGSLLGTGMEVMIKPFSLDDFAHKVAALTAPGRAEATQT